MLRSTEQLNSRAPPYSQIMSVCHGRPPGDRPCRQRRITLISGECAYKPNPRITDAGAVGRCHPTSTHTSPMALGASVRHSASGICIRPPCSLRAAHEPARCVAPVCSPSRSTCTPFTNTSPPVRVLVRLGEGCKDPDLGRIEDHDVREAAGFETTATLDREVFSRRTASCGALPLDRRDLRRRARSDRRKCETHRRRRGCGFCSRNTPSGAIDLFVRSRCSPTAASRPKAHVVF